MNWQGTGNLNNDHLTAIWTYINTNFQLSWTSNTIRSNSARTLPDFATGLSDHLNSRWDPAWNVVVTHMNPPNINFNDAVVYGYAFRDRWMWYNGVTMNDGSFVGFIIWKDYNCIAWVSYGDTGPYIGSSFSTADGSVLQSVLTAFRPTAPNGDIWASAKGLSEAL